ncbi:hypothetical protein QQ020_06020 [Fulvivirgaceae bacterium BMA12]|uniref:DUF2157 domain-containing protein n=1 Tax=Agaribacillus aureus TaxID=3051825 RepID=A0ABT8L466_9BACT|nr:hypothetical protein [Fulvivirgaceae bacterium BMA12]
MGQLNKKHLSKIENYLDRQGLSFQPLRDEMMDHLIEDLENHMAQGNSFDEAWHLIMGKIPDNHFITLQKETVEIINKRFNLSRGFTYVSLILLFTAAIFKQLHFPFSGILLLTSFGAIAASLITGTLSGFLLHKEKEGKWMILGVISGAILFLISYGFQILKLPGFEELRLISIILLILFFPGLTIYFGAKKRSEENILIYLHKKHSPGIERYLVFLLFVATTLRIASIAFNFLPDISHFFLVLVIFGAYLQYFALNWHYPNNKNWWLLAGLVAGFLCFIVASVVSSMEVRVIFALLFFLITGLIVLKRSNEISHKIALISLVTFISTVLITWRLTGLHFIDPSFYPTIFNIPILVVLLSGLIFFRKQSLVKMYMLLVITQYCFFLM